MKKNKIVILAIVILIVLVAIIVFVIKGKNGEKNNESKLLKIYDNLVSSQTYLFAMKQNDENKTIMARKGDKTIIDTYSEGNRTTTLVKEGNTYLILHDREEYYFYQTNNVEQSILTDGIEEIIGKEFTTGEEKVKGKKYKYEEYTGSTFFITSNILNIDEQEIKTRLYFDNNNNFVYVKILYGDEQEILQIELQNEVEDSIFEIPAHYAEGN